MKFSTPLRITRKFTEPDRGELDYDGRWKGNDGGLITCWENGRKWRQDKPGLADRAMKGELPVLAWKGGIGDDINCDNELKAKYGALYYLAKLQGLSGLDLDIDPSAEIPLMCSRTGWLVVFTGDSNKYDKALGMGNALEICHTTGKEMRDSDPELAVRVERGELPVLNWPGGFDAEASPPRQFGSFFYLAQWQGLRGEQWHGITGNNKNMSTTHPVGIKCAVTGMATIFTKDARKYLSSHETPDIERYPTPVYPGIQETYIPVKGEATLET